MARSASKASKSPSQGSKTKVFKSAKKNVKDDGHDGHDDDDGDDGNGGDLTQTPGISSSSTKRGPGRPKGGVRRGGRPKGGKRTVEMILKAQGVPNFQVYIHRILKDVQPTCRISKTSMSIMNSFLNDMLTKITAEAKQLINRIQKKTLDARALQSAVRLLLPGELAKHAVSEGTKAVTKYTNYSIV